MLASPEPLSFWGGVEPSTARVIDARHPLAGQSLSGRVLVMPTSRGSCSGSGVWLDLALNGRAPAALIFREKEDVLTLGALVAAEMFGVGVPVVRLAPPDYARAAEADTIRIGDGALFADGAEIALEGPRESAALSAADRALLDGASGEAARQAMRIVVAMAAAQGAAGLIDVARVHIDGCIYASPANLVFAERMAALGGRVRVPTTTNAISVDRENWRAQGVAADFGGPAERLADAYLRMGCAPSFTCAPYLLDPAPRAGECIAWAESNAAIYANSVLGARTAKHPDFLDLCIALTGRAPLAGPYLDEGRRARLVLDVERPVDADDAFWPLLGLVAGRRAGERIPLLRGLSAAGPTEDDLKALCAAFGTTAGAPMLQIEGVTPEAVAALDAERGAIRLADLAAAWDALNAGPVEVDLVAFGSPHASLSECRAIVESFGARRRRDEVAAIVTAGRATIAAARREGLLARLEGAGLSVLPDLCWCSITEPLFPPGARVVMTNSGKYAHYGPGLSGRTVRFGALADCVEAAITGRAPRRRPEWLASGV